VTDTPLKHEDYSTDEEIVVAMTNVYHLPPGAVAGALALAFGKRSTWFPVPGTDKKYHVQCKPEGKWVLRVKQDPVSRSKANRNRRERK
jgi:hypothetical protein